MVILADSKKSSARLWLILGCASVLVALIVSLALFGTARIIYWLIVLAPGVPFFVLEISYGRILQQKRAELQRKFQTSERVASAYTQAYGVEALDDALKEFHHWRTYIVPIILTSLIASTIMAIALAKIPADKALIDLGLPNEVERKMILAPEVMIAGAAGAYLWGLYGLLKRYGSADVSSIVLHFTWLQIAIGAAVGAIAAPYIFQLTPSLLVLGAFVIGALPFRRIDQLIKKTTGLADPKVDENPSMNLIQGLTPDVRQRLDDEDIDSVQRVAYTDPIRLLFRTNIEWNVILDLIDQAILINFVGDKVNKLRPLGIRGAIEVAELYHRGLGNETPQDLADAANAKAMLDLIGSCLIEVTAGEKAGTLAREAAYNCSYQFANDPVVDFVWEHWMASYEGVEDNPEDHSDK